VIDLCVHEWIEIDADFRGDELLRKLEVLKLTSVCGQVWVASSPSSHQLQEKQWILEVIYNKLIMMVVIWYIGLYIIMCFEY
jgi:hypothetical protein